MQTLQTAYQTDKLAESFREREKNRNIRKNNGNFILNKIIMTPMIYVIFIEIKRRKKANTRTKANDGARQYTTIRNSANA